MVLAVGLAARLYVTAYNLQVTVWDGRGDVLSSSRQVNGRSNIQPRRKITTEASSALRLLLANATFGLKKTTMSWLMTFSLISQTSPFGSWAGKPITSPAGRCPEMDARATAKPGHPVLIDTCSAASFFKRRLRTCQRIYRRKSFADLAAPCCGSRVECYERLDSSRNCDSA